MKVKENTYCLHLHITEVKGNRKQKAYLQQGMSAETIISGDTRVVFSPSCVRAADSYKEKKTVSEKQKDNPLQ